jgi:hypothetical protein
MSGEVRFPSLLASFLKLLGRCSPAFSQERTANRAQRLALGLAIALGTRTISRAIAATGRDQHNWVADYRVFSRSPWQTRSLFSHVIEETLRHCAGDENIVAAGDFTHVAKTGRKIPGVSCMRDPMSPPFHPNLIYGLRFMHLTLLCASHDEKDPGAALPTRSIPVLFEPSPVLSKPGKKATEEELKQWKAKTRERLSSRHARQCIEQLRADLDAAGASSRKLYTVLDGSFCNAVFFEKPMERVELICRSRKDAKLRRPLEQQTGRRIYAERTFTPEQVRQQDETPWQAKEFFHGGGWYPVRYKDAGIVIWQKGAKERPLRLIVVAPTGYLRGGIKHYRQPGYLLTTDLITPAAILVDYYLQRWQIEVNHREQKQTIGVGHAQVRSPKSVSRQPAFSVAVYSLLLLAAHDAHGARRTDDYLTAPKWGRKNARPSIQDIINLLRSQLDAYPDMVRHLEVSCSSADLVRKAAA